MRPFSFAAGCVAGIAGMGLLYAVFMIIHPWVRMKLCGGKESLLHIIGMRLRGNPVSMIVEAYVSLLHTGAIVTLGRVESHYVANRARITCARDIVDSMSKEPIDTHVAVWLTSEDAEWLADHLTEHADRLGGDDSPGAARDVLERSPESEESYDRKECCRRIADVARSAASNAKKVADRNGTSSESAQSDEHRM